MVLARKADFPVVRMLSAICMRPQRLSRLQQDTRGLAE
jgi:hypothetical protein